MSKRIYWTWCLVFCTRLIRCIYIYICINIHNIIPKQIEKSNPTNTMMRNCSIGLHVYTHIYIHICIYIHTYVYIYRLSIYICIYTIYRVIVIDYDFPDNQKTMCFSVLFRSVPGQHAQLMLRIKYCFDCFTL